MDTNYFKSYEDLHIHKLMLNDSQRIKAYKDAILSNCELFKNSKVLDVGAGSGILSVFAAQAGAKRVYSVEAAPSMIPIIKKITAENKFNDVIEVIEGEIEKIDLLEKVDIIISEWMGFFLLHEGMLDSVLYAKKFLKEGGVMFPAKCSIFVSACELPVYFDMWNDIEGVKMSSFGEAFREAAQHKPDICFIDHNWLLTDPLEILSFKPMESDQADFKLITAKHVIPANRDGKYQGICIWFTVLFPTPSKNIILSTSPFAPETHWKQTVIALPSEVIIEEHEPIAFELSFYKNGTRTYQISFSMLKSDEVEHPLPCDCWMTRCQVIKAFMRDNNPS